MEATKKYSCKYIFFGLCVVLICFFLQASFKRLSELLERPLGTDIDYTVPLNDQADALPYSRSYELELSSFEILPNCLGSGQFGKVLKGKLTNGRFVAIKIPGGKKIFLSLERVASLFVCADLTKTEFFRALIDELKIMSHIRPHVNVLNLVGACTTELENRQLYVITEFCENGSLKDYLEDNYIKFEGVAFDFASNQFRVS